MFYAARGIFGTATSNIFFCQGSSGHEAIILLALEQLYEDKHTLSTIKS